MNNLAIFDTFKTKDQLTGKAERQRKIIQLLGSGDSEIYTKVEIAKKITSEEKQSWRNTYSGIYEDIEDVFLPGGIIVEKGKIPLKRGPRSLQKEGTAFYELTKTGMLLLYCIEKGKIKFDFTGYTSDRKLGEELNSLSSINSTLCFLLLEEYVSTHCKKGLEIVPITLKNLEELHKMTIKYNLKLIESILSCNIKEQSRLLDFLVWIKPKH